MTNSLFAPEEVDSERTVIISERHGAENNPGFALYEEVSGAAFHAHPYGHMIIGYETDLRRLTRRISTHTTVATIIQRMPSSSRSGIFPPKRSWQSSITRSAASPGLPRRRLASASTSPSSLASAESCCESQPAAPYFRMAFHAPAAAGPDFVPMLVADAILSGAKPRGFGGGAVLGRSSRLNQALVSSGLARTAGSDVGISLDPYLLQIGVTGLPDSDLEKIEQAVDNELERLREEEVSADELRGAIRQLEAQIVYAAEGVTNQAYWLGQWEIVDRWSRTTSLVDEIRAVAASDVQRVAQAYLRPESRTVGWLVPTRSGGDSGADSDPAREFAIVTAWGLDGPAHGDRRWCVWIPSCRAAQWDPSAGPGAPGKSVSDSPASCRGWLSLRGSIRARPRLPDGVFVDPWRRRHVIRRDQREDRRASAARFPSTADASS